MGHQCREMLGVARNWLLSRACAEELKETQEACGIMIGNRAVGTRITLISAKGPLWHHYRGAELVAAMKQTKFNKVAGCPAAQLLKALELASIWTTPTARISRFRRRLQFDKGASGRTLVHKSDIRPTNTGIAIFGDNNEAWRSG
jgi:hypothetical protein